MSRFNWEAFQIDADQIYYDAWCTLGQIVWSSCQHQKIFEKIGRCTCRIEG
jgi:hypothetical protein